MSTPRWEYLFVHIGLARGFTDVAWRPYSANGQRLDHWERGVGWQDYFQEVGSQGWEFVTFDDHFLKDTSIGGKLAIFKRAVPTLQPTTRGTAPFITG